MDPVRFLATASARAVPSPVQHCINTKPGTTQMNTTVEIKTQVQARVDGRKFAETKPSREQISARAEEYADAWAVDEDHFFALLHAFRMAAIGY